MSGKAGASILPHGEQLRRAIAWLAVQPTRSPAVIEEAARRFDLTPLEEEFLLAWRNDPPQAGQAPAD